MLADDQPDSGAYMIDNLMGKSPIILQEIVILGSTGMSQLLDDWQNLAQLIVRYVRQLGSVMLRYDELGCVSSPGC